MNSVNAIANPADSKSKDRYRWFIFYLLIILTALQLFIALFTNGFALSQEEAMWHYIGRNWFRYGLVPYHGGADNKSPLFFVIFGLSDRFFGVNYWFPRVLGTMVQTAGIFYVYKIARQISGRRAGWLVVSFYGLSVLWHGADGKYVSFTETYEMFFVILSFYFLLNPENKSACFTSGILAALGIGFRLSALFIIPALFITSFQKGWKPGLQFCIGLLTGIVALALAGYVAGINLRDTMRYMITDNFGPGSINNTDFVTRMVQFYNLFFYSEAVLFYPLVLVYIFIKRKADWLILWLILGFIGINAVGNYARVDLKELLPALSLMGGLSLAYLIDTFHISLRKLLFIVWVCFSPKLIEPFVTARWMYGELHPSPENHCHEPYAQPDEGAGRQLGLWVKANTSEHDKVYVAGYGSQVQVYSERLSPSIYFNVTQTRIAKERLFSDMKASKADMILIPLFPSYKQWVDSDLRDYIDQLVSRNYYFDRCLFSYAVYRQKKIKNK